MSLSGTLRRKGALVTFTNPTTATYDASADTTASSTATTVDMDAMEVDGDPELYKTLELIESESPTLLCKPRTSGQLPAIGAKVTWGSVAYSVKNIKRLAMAGTPTAARIVVAR